MNHGPRDAELLAQSVTSVPKFYKHDMLKERSGLHENRVGNALNKVCAINGESRCVEASRWSRLDYGKSHRIIMYVAGITHQQCWSRLTTDYGNEACVLGSVGPPCFAGCHYGAWSQWDHCMQSLRY